jgi:hypothetical protein
VASSLASYFVCPGYDEEDIEQEAFFIGVATVGKFDPTRGKQDVSEEQRMKNFLYWAMSTRLSNLKKEKTYDYRKDHPQSVNRSKKIISYPVRLTEKSTYEHDFESVDNQEIMDLIMAYMPTKFREDYQRILEGEPVQSVRKGRIIAEAQNIYDLIMQDRVSELDDRFSV